MRNIMSLIIASLISISAFAQGEEAGGGLMRSNLKIYVVVAVLLIIFSGIILFLLGLEKRLEKLEEKNL
jgi:hypothetical protein